MGKILEVKNLTVHIKTHKGVVQAVRGVDFYLNEQETLAVVGESGSGKSITMKGVMGILPKNGKVVEGSVMFQGNDLTKYSERQMQQVRGSEIAMIFQDPMTSLNPTMKVGKQIEEIAIALACDPKVLIADEPTTALDVTIQAQILDLMRDLQKKIKTSIIIITHNLGVVANIADRVAVMYGGKLVETGDVEDIFHNPCHEYTKGLLRSIPKAHEKGGELQAIPGTPPDLMEPPVGCPFAARCKETMIVCQKYMPDYTDCGKNHKSACWMLDEMAQEVNSDEK